MSLVQNKKFQCLNFSSYFDRLHEYDNPNYIPTQQDYVFASAVESDVSLAVASVTQPQVSSPAFDFTSILHIDFFVQICQHLPISSILALLCVNKPLHNVMNQELFWKRLYTLQWGTYSAEGVNWKRELLATFRATSIKHEIEDFEYNDIRSGASNTNKRNIYPEF
jgi:hypothetical protein